MLGTDGAAQWIADCYHLNREFRWLAVVVKQEAEVNAVPFGGQPNIVPGPGTCNGRRAETATRQRSGHVPRIGMKHM